MLRLDVVHGQTVTHDAPTAWEKVDGVDSQTDEGRGDWFRKREFLRHARRLLQDITQQVATVTGLEKELVAIYEPLATASVQKVASLDVKRPQIEQALADTQASIEREAAREVAQTEADKQRLLDLNDLKKLLTEFLEEYTYLIELQESIAQAVTLLHTQAEQCKEYEQKAWQLYEAIDQALSDKVAEQLFYQMETISENIKLSHTYMHDTLQNHLMTHTKIFDTQFAHVMEQYKLLQEKGLFVKAPEAISPAASKTVPAKASASWWSRVGSTLASPFVWVADAARALWKRIF